MNDDQYIAALAQDLAGDFVDATNGKLAFANQLAEHLSATMLGLQAARTTLELTNGNVDDAIRLLGKLRDGVAD